MKPVDVHKRTREETFPEAADHGARVVRARVHAGSDSWPQTSYYGMQNGGIQYGLPYGNSPGLSVAGGRAQNFLHVGTHGVPYGQYGAQYRTVTYNGIVYAVTTVPIGYAQGGTAQPPETNAESEVKDAANN